MLFFYLLSVTQIFFEVLPVSSSGHIALLEKIVAQHAVEIGGIKYWLYLLHLPTALVVLGYFYYPLTEYVSSKKYSSLLYIICLVGIVDLITVLFFLVEPWFSITLPLPIAFGLTGVMLFSTRYKIKSTSTMTMPQALMIGMVQGLLLLTPGVSRLAGVYTALRWMGIPSFSSFAFAWLVLWPLMVAAGTLGAYKLFSHGYLFDFLSVPMLLAILCATVCSWGAMSVMGFLAQRNLFWLMSSYMIVPLLLSIMW